MSEDNVAAPTLPAEEKQEGGAEEKEGGAEEKSKEKQENEPVEKHEEKMEEKQDGVTEGTAKGETKEKMEENVQEQKDETEQKTDVNTEEKSQEKKIERVEEKKEETGLDEEEKPEVKPWKGDFKIEGKVEKILTDPDTERRDKIRAERKNKIREDDERNAQIAKNSLQYIHHRTLQVLSQEKNSLIPNHVVFVVMYIVPVFVFIQVSNKCVPNIMILLQYFYSKHPDHVITHYAQPYVPFHIQTVTA